MAQEGVFFGVPLEVVGRGRTLEGEDDTDYKYAVFICSLLIVSGDKHLSLYYFWTNFFLHLRPNQFVATVTFAEPRPLLIESLCFYILRI